VRSAFIGALGCTTAWGLVDAVMFLLAIDRTTTQSGDPATSGPRRRRAVAPAHSRGVAPMVAATMEPEEVDVIRSRLAGLLEPNVPASTGGATALGVFLMVFSPRCRLRCRSPSSRTPCAARANGITVMLFLGGYYLGRTAAPPWRAGLAPWRSACCWSGDYRVRWLTATRRWARRTRTRLVEACGAEFPHRDLEVEVHLLARDAHRAKTAG
jgi:hypothetical protein